MFIAGNKYPCVKPSSVCNIYIVVNFLNIVGVLIRLNYDTTYVIYMLHYFEKNHYIH